MANNNKDKIKGSFFGGAIGDALGYPVEFMQYAEITQKYGETGITRYNLDSNGVAQISDDTQMTLFTANGLLFGYSRLAMRGIMGDPSSYIKDSYLEWLQTQTGEIDYTKWHYNWIREVKELHSRRAPGTTCLQALQAIANHQTVKNNSKGCGGIMRVAPIPLYYHGKMKQSPLMKIAGDVAGITHKHPLGFLPAALLAHLISSLIPCKSPTSYQIASHLQDGIMLLQEIYPNYNNYISQIKYLIEKAGRRALSNLSDEEAIRQLGEGWVAEETLAIAVFCSMRYPDNFEKAVVASVNHSGDSDSTGAVTGNIMGAIVGYNAIPQHFKDNLELGWLINEIAEDLADGIPVGEYLDNYDTPQKRRWMEKYVDVISNDLVPIKNAYLVDGQLKLYAGEYPGDKDDEMCCIKIKDSVWYGFQYFYDLTEKGELNPYSHFLPRDKVYTRFPIPDCGVPDNTSAVHRLIDEIIHRGETEYKTYIHCWGGVGRTGTIVACLYAYLMRNDGLTPSELYTKAIQRLKDSFGRCPKSKYRESPENELQRNFVKQFISNECYQK